MNCDEAVGWAPIIWGVAIGILLSLLIAWAEREDGY